VKAADLTVALEVELVKRVAGKALLVVIDGVDHWLPLSQIMAGGTLDADAEEGAEGDILVTAWWAKSRGLDG